MRTLGIFDVLHQKRAQTHLGNLAEVVPNSLDNA